MTATTFFTGQNANACLKPFYLNFLAIVLELRGEFSVVYCKSKMDR